MTPALALAALAALAPPGAHVRIAASPAQVVAGERFAPTLKVLVSDAHGNPVPDIWVEVTSAPLQDRLLGGLVERTQQDGIAVFDDLAIETTGLYRIVAAVEHLTATSDPIEIVPGSPATIAVAGGDGQSARVGTLFATPLRALVHDTLGNPAAGASVALRTPEIGASALFDGQRAITVIADTDGVATSPPLRANEIVGAVEVIAESDTHQAVFALDNLAADAWGLRFDAAPASTTARAPLGTIGVQIVDDADAPHAAPDVSVAIDLQEERGAAASSLQGTRTQLSDASGHAAFGDLSFLRAGRYRLVARAKGATDALSPVVLVEPAPPASLTIVGTATQSAEAQTLFALPLVVRVDDAFGEPIENAAVHWTVPTSEPTTVLSDTLAPTDAAGQAQVQATAGSTPGSYVVSASVGEVPPISWTLTNLALPGVTLSLISQPSSTVAGAPSLPIVVALHDQLGSPVPGQAIDASVQSAQAVLHGATRRETDTQGEAHFDDLALERAGEFRLVFTHGASTAVADPFTVSADAPATLEIVEGDGQSAQAAEPFASPLAVQVMDRFGNPTPAVEVHLGEPLSTSVLTDAQGLAESPGVTAGSLAGPLHIPATVEGLPPVTFTLEVLPAGASHLAFATQPERAIAGHPMAPVDVQLEDAHGSPMSQEGVVVSLSTTAPLGEGERATDPNGLARFDNLVMTHAGTYTLLAEARGLASAVSESFSIDADAPEKLSAVGPIQQETERLHPFPSPLQISLADAFGNPIQGATIAFDVETDGTVSIDHDRATTDEDGVAQTGATADQTAGTFSVVASIAGLDETVTFVLTVLEAATHPATLVKLAGGDQATRSGTAFPVRLSVRVEDAEHEPAPGVAVQFTAPPDRAAFAEEGPALSDQDGIATAPELIAGETLGNFTVTASSDDLAPVSFSLTIEAGAAPSVTGGCGCGAQTAAPTLWGLLALALGLRFARRRRERIRTP